MSEVLETALRLVGVLVAFLVVPLLVGQAEHKAMAHMQGRVGPMYAGAFHGWAQLVADGVKFVQKEDVVPAAADRTVFKRACEPQDVSNAIAFLCSYLASYVTGIELNVSGGVELFVF